MSRFRITTGKKHIKKKIRGDFDGERKRGRESRYKAQRKIKMEGEERRR